MKNKIIFTLISFLLVVPSLVNGYNPTNEELRSSIFDYIGTQSQRQQTQDILDDGNRAYKSYFDTYYREVDSLQAEHDFKLKQLQADIDAREREEAWQKEKQLLDKQLQMTNENKKLQEEINKLKAEEETKRIIEEALDVSGRITPLKSDKDLSYDSFLKEKQQKEQQSKKSEKGMFDDVFLPSQQTTSTPTQIISEQPVIETTIAPSPKKNVFKNIFERFMGLFK